MDDTRRYRRLRELLRKTWAHTEPYALNAKTEDMLVRMLVKIEIEGIRHGRHQHESKERFRP